MPRRSTAEETQPRTQVVERVSRILSVLARHGSDGCRLVDVAEETGSHGRPRTGCCRS